MPAFRAALRMRLHLPMPMRLLLCAMALHATAAGAASLPPEPLYRGELVGDGKGGVAVRPLPPEAQDAAPAGRKPQAERRAAPERRPQITPLAEPEPQRGPGAGALTLLVGVSQKIRTIAQAAKIARSGDTILIEPGVYAGDVAVFTQDKLTIRVAGGRARLNANGASAEGKAIWVVRGGHIVVENIEFVGARVPNHNGAGIRFEKGRLVLRNCLFRDNENGILTSGNKEAELDIENTEFDRNGTEDGFGHQLYAGEIASLKVSGSYFHHAVGGHLIKSRAGVNHILYNRLSDEAGGEASYELEFPSGGQAYVVGNLIEQSASSQNPAIVAVGLEGYRWPKNELYLINNTIIDDLPARGVFLRTAPGLQLLKAFNNLLVGEPGHEPGILAGDGKNAARKDDDGMNIEVRNNVSATREAFMQAAQFDYRVRDRARLAGKYQPPGSADGVDLTPRAEYAHPAQSRRLTAAPTLPGALQSVAR